MSAVVCALRNEPQPGYDAPEPEEVGVRTALMGSYSWGAFFYEWRSPAVRQLKDRLGAIVWYATTVHPTRRKRISMDVDQLVERWHKLVVGLAIAHDKDEADRYEAMVDDCLQPLLTAPVKQLREFAPRLSAALKADRSVPYLVWRAYEYWMEQMAKAPDEDVKELRKDLAQEIATMVDAEVKAQLPDALVRALQWRSPERLAEVRDAVVREKQAGRGVRLKGRESCLFLEVQGNGTEEQPEVCVQI